MPIAKARGAAAQPVTPRKRKTGTEDAPTPETRGKGKARGPPTPNPPLAPFPTPPSSRQRTDDIPLPSNEHFFHPPEPSLSASTPAQDIIEQHKILPPSLETLMKLHHAFNLALSLHFATHPPVLPPHSVSATKLELPNLTNFLAIKGTVERTGGRRFGLPELGRLAWLWTWDGDQIPGKDLVSVKEREAREAQEPRSSKKDSENPFLVSDPEAEDRQTISGLSYLITPTRTLDPSSGRRVHTYGIGIELDLKPGETRNLLSELEGSGSRGQGGGAGAISRWNGSGDVREKEVRRRLEKWVDLHGGYESPAQADLPTPQTTSNQRSSIPPIPLLPLPKLPTATLLPAANLFANTPVPSTSSSRAPAPMPSGLADPFVIDDTDKKTKVVRNGSVEERRKAMMDRIKARAGTGRQPTLGSSVGQLNSIRPRATPLAQIEELKRRSTLSRLESVAEGVWMMFSAPSPGPNTLPTPPRGRRKAIPMLEVADVIVKSSKTPISQAEAQDSIKMLTELCPFFLTIKVVAKQDWVEMPSAFLATCPASPGSSSLSRFSKQAFPSPSSRTPDAPTSPSHRRPIKTAEPVSPSPGSRTTMDPQSPTSPTSRPYRAVTPPPHERGQTMAPRPPVSPIFNQYSMTGSSPHSASKALLAGAASPGRVHRYGGLRQVRERIRRELGE